MEFNKLVNPADVHQAQKLTLNDYKEKKKTKKNIHWSDTLDEIFNIPIDENQGGNGGFPGFPWNSQNFHGIFVGFGISEIRRLTLQFRLVM